MLLFSSAAGRRSAALALCAAWAMSTPAAAGQQAITAVRFWSLPDATRIAVETTGPFDFKSDRLSNPDRIFFDIPAAFPRLGHKGINVIRVEDDFLHQIRVAETQHGVIRIVLDLTMPVEVSTSKLTNPDRLVIELHRPGASSKPAPEVITEAPIREAPITEASPREAREARVFQPPYMPPLRLDKRNWPVIVLDAPAPETGYAWRFQVRRDDPLAGLWVPRDGAPPPPAVAVATKSYRLVPAPAKAASAEPRQTPSDSRSNAQTETRQLAAGRPLPPSMAEPLTTTAVTPKASHAEIAPEKIGLPAKRPNTARDESMIRALGLKVGRIVIDAGHGGHDTGTVGPGGLMEKDLVLDVAQRLGALIEQRLSCEVIYTRTDDTFIPLEERTRIANQKHADLFLSIHANSSEVRTVAGVETYYLNFTTSKVALDVAARENATSQKTVFELQDLLQKIALKDKVDESREFALRVQNSLYATAVKTNARTRDRGVRKAPFIVLIGATMPSVLAEIGFVSNPRDETMMKRAEYREKLAEALYKGVASYASTLSHFQVAQSRLQ